MPRHDPTSLLMQTPRIPGASRPSGIQPSVSEHHAWGACLEQAAADATPHSSLARPLKTMVFAVARAVSSEAWPNFLPAPTASSRSRMPTWRLLAGATGQTALVNFISSVKSALLVSSHPVRRREAYDLPQVDNQTKHHRGRTRDRRVLGRSYRDPVAALVVEPNRASAHSWLLSCRPRG